MAATEEDQRIASDGREDSLQVLRRAASALDEIATAPSRLRLVDIGSNLGLAKSTARRLLVALVEVGFAAVDDSGHYRLGDRLLGLASADGAHLAAMLRPVIERIALATGETVDLSVLRGRQMWFIDQIESTHRLRAVSAIGGRFPLQDTANGKAALATLEDDELCAVLATFEPATVAQLRREILEVRSTGIAYDRDEHTVGISAAAVAGRLHGGHVVAISVPAPTDRFLNHEAAIVEALHEAAGASLWEPDAAP